MHTNEIGQCLTALFSELVDGANAPAGGYILNSGDAGLLKSLDKLTAAEASRATQAGATLAAHATHLRYGLSLMNRWAAQGGNPFADATWEEAWKVTSVNDNEWTEIRKGLRDEVHRWLRALGSPREVTPVELNGMIGSIGHLAYHFGAMRQIAAGARGPKEGTCK